MSIEKKYILLAVDYVSKRVEALLTNDAEVWGSIYFN